jgi:hypothetical protein
MESYQGSRFAVDPSLVVRNATGMAKSDARLSLLSVDVAPRFVTIATNDGIISLSR